MKTGVIERKITAKEWDTMVELNELLDSNMLPYPKVAINTAKMTTTENDIIHDVYVPYILNAAEENMNPKERLAFDMEFIEVVSKYGERIRYASK